MWLRVALKNYRSIESATVDLAPFTVLVGPNGSGKSNFADALVLASELGFDAASAIQRRGGLGAIRRWGLTDEEPLEVRICYHEGREPPASDRSVEQLFSLVPDEGTRWRFQDEHLFWEEQGNLPTRYIRQGIPATTSVMLFVRQFHPEYPLQVRRLALDLGKMRVPQPPGDARVLLEDGGNLTSVLGHLRNFDEPGFAFILAAMRRVVPGLEDILTEEVGGFLALKFRQRQPSGVATFNAFNMSEGALRALGIIVAAQTLARTSPSKKKAAPELLIVEEPEVSIHPGAAALLFEVLKLASQRGFVLVTTHSPELLDAAQDEEILVCDYREGTTHVGPLAKAQRDVVREGLLSLSESPAANRSASRVRNPKPWIPATSTHEAAGLHRGGRGRGRRHPQPVCPHPEAPGRSGLGRGLGSHPVQALEARGPPFSRAPAAMPGGGDPQGDGIGPAAAARGRRAPAL